MNTSSCCCLPFAADYRQIEFRLMAHFSGDEGLCRIFGDSGGADPFVLLAAQWLGIPASQVRRDLEQGRALASRLCSVAS